ncbi:MAG: glutamate 5-kinase, partial [Chloroflexi bacterium]|nr:glutamate 5-kinase [Chloroflexota bacterium]
MLTRSPGHQSLDLEVMSDLVRQVCHLRSQSAEMLLVTSGAIAAGREALGHGQDAVDRDITSRQVLAAVGQNRLMHIYQELFSAHGYQVAQVLLTINDLSDRQSYLNVRNTLQGLLELGVVPILNENDVVAVDEIGEVFGDNDR